LLSFACGATLAADEARSLIEAPVDQPATAPAEDQLAEIIIQALEPRYVAPTRRDRIGRIWAPVYINGKGPFRMVLDTGASHSGVIAAVANALGMPLDQSPPVRLRGVTGSAVVPTIRAESLQMGELLLKPAMLPIVTDALGGAQGILGTEGLDDKRIYIDFRLDQIVISRSHSERAPRDFMTIPVKFSRGKLLTIEARVGNFPVTAIIDTGGQATIGNNALRDMLLTRRRQEQSTVDKIIGATLHEQQGVGMPVPPITLGDIEIRSERMTFGDMSIFEFWKMTKEPAVLIGMDALGLLDTLVIDYKRRELQVRLRP